MSRSNSNASASKAPWMPSANGLRPSRRSVARRDTNENEPSSGGNSWRRWLPIWSPNGRDDASRGPSKNAPNTPNSTNPATSMWSAGGEANAAGSPHQKDNMVLSKSHSSDRLASTHQNLAYRLCDSENPT